MTKLFAVGFPRDYDELQLAQLFGPYGDIDLLTIVREQASGHSKGFGFIHMKDAIGAQEAIKGLNGYPFDERQMEVRLADAKTIPVKRPAIQPKYTAVQRAPEKKKRPRISR